MHHLPGTSPVPRDQPRQDALRQSSLTLRFTDRQAESEYQRRFAASCRSSDFDGCLVSLITLPLFLHQQDVLRRGSAQELLWSVGSTMGLLGALVLFWAHAPSSSLWLRTPLQMAIRLQRMLLLTYWAKRLPPEGHMPMSSQNLFIAALTASGATSLVLHSLMGRLPFREHIMTQLVCAAIALLHVRETCLRGYLSVGRSPSTAAADWAGMLHVQGLLGTCSAEHIACASCTVVCVMLQLVFGLGFTSGTLFLLEQDSREQFAELHGRRQPGPRSAAARSWLITTLLFTVFVYHCFVGALAWSTVSCPSCRK